MTKPNNARRIVWAGIIIWMLLCISFCLYWAWQIAALLYSGWVR